MGSCRARSVYLTSRLKSLLADKLSSASSSLKPFNKSTSSSPHTPPLKKKKERKKIIIIIIINNKINKKNKIKEQTDFDKKKKNDTKLDPSQNSIYVPRIDALVHAEVIQWCTRRNNVV